MTTAPAAGRTPLLGDRVGDPPRRSAGALALASGLISVLCAAVLLASSGMLLAGAPSGPCTSMADDPSAPITGTRVLATTFGGPGDASTHGSTTGAGGSLDGRMAWAELSSNWQAALADLDFAALGGLPMHANLRITYRGRSVIAQKLDVGRGGPPINGHQRQIDLWWQTARALHFAGTGMVRIEPVDGDTGPARGSGACAPQAQDVAGLQTTPGRVATIDPDTGEAIAPHDAPVAVKRMLAAGNRIRATSYSEGSPHGTPRTRVLDHYDCSSAVAYVLYWGGALDSPTRNEWSGSLTARGRPGRGRWVTWYADAEHAYLEVAGIRLDTSSGFGGPNIPPGDGPRWRSSSRPPGSKIARHPSGL